MGRFFHRRHERPEQEEPSESQNGSSVRSNITVTLRSQVDRVLGNDGCSQPNISNKEATDLAARLSLSPFAAGVSRGEVYRLLYPMYYTRIQRRVLNLCIREPVCKQAVLFLQTVGRVEMPLMQKRCPGLSGELCQKLEILGVVMGTHHPPYEVSLTPLGVRMAVFFAERTNATDNDLIEACIQMFEQEDPESRKERRKRERRQRRKNEEL